MPASEIDDIFAAKGKTKASSSSAAPSQPAQPAKKKKSAKKRKRDAEQGTDCAPDGPTKQQRIPETVLDPSAHLSAPPNKLRKTEKRARNDDAKEKKKSKEEEDRFKDSRGTGPRRTTEEGFAIYKEDELGISHEGGDTPLCPFDCQCCF